MKKSDYSGWKEVFRFSFIQGIKQKSYLALLIIMGVAILFGPTLFALFGGSDEEKESTPVTIEKLMVFDEVGIPIDYENAYIGTNCENVQIDVKQVMNSDDFDAYIKGYEDAKDSNEIALRIAFNEGGYFELVFIKASDTAFSEDEADEVVETFVGYFESKKLTVIDVSEEEYAFINQPIVSEVLFTSETGEIMPEEEKPEGISLDEYYVLLGGIMVCLMIITLSGSSIATSIVTEKSTRVIEYLMINVRPMALIVGKILACLSLTLIQFAVIGVGYVGSTVVQGMVLGAENTKSFSEIFSFVSVLEGINIANIILAAAIIFVGILFYAILAGLAGASVSKMDELAEGMKMYQMAQMVGSYIGIGICLMEIMGDVSPIIINTCSLIPIATPFIIPATLLMGRITTLVAVIGLVILIAVTVLLYMFTANVYESMIFYNGKVLKLKDILQISKTRRKGDA